MKTILAAATVLVALQASAWALDINQFQHFAKMGDRCRANIAGFRAYGLVPAGGGQNIMCFAQAYVGTPCTCYFGQYRVRGQVVRSSDYADIKN